MNEKGLFLGVFLFSNLLVNLAIGQENQSQQEADVEIWSLNTNDFLALDIEDIFIVMRRSDPTIFVYRINSWYPNSVIFFQNQKILRITDEITNIINQENELSREDQYFLTNGIRILRYAYDYFHSGQDQLQFNPLLIEEELNGFFSVLWNQRNILLDEGEYFSLCLKEWLYLIKLTHTPPHYDLVYRRIIRFYIDNPERIVNIKEYYNLYEVLSLYSSQILDADYDMSVNIDQALFDLFSDLVFVDSNLENWVYAKLYVLRAFEFYIYFFFTNADPHNYYELIDQYLFDYIINLSEEDPIYLKAVNVLFGKYFGRDCMMIDELANPICLVQIHQNFKNRLFTHSISFNAGEITIQSSLEEEELYRLYLGSLQVKANFFELTRSFENLDNIQLPLHVRVYLNRHQYQIYEELLFDNYLYDSGIYFEQNQQIITYQREDGLEPNTLFETFKHEYAHYLTNKYLVPGLWGEAPIYEGNRMSWFEEGFAEYLSNATQLDGVLVKKKIVERTMADFPTWNLSDLVGASQLTYAVYRYGALFFNFLDQQNYYSFKRLIQSLKSDSIELVDQYFNFFDQDPQINSSYQEFLDQQMEEVEELINVDNNFLLSELLEASIEDLPRIAQDLSENFLRKVSCQMTGERDDFLRGFACDGFLSNDFYPYRWENDFRIEVKKRIKLKTMNLIDHSFSNYKTMVCYPLENTYWKVISRYHFQPSVLIRCEGLLLH